MNTGGRPPSSTCMPRNRYACYFDNVHMRTYVIAASEAEAQRMTAVYFRCPPEQVIARYCVTVCGKGKR